MPSFQPPIIEAVLDIECELPADFSLPSLEKIAQEQLKASHPKKRHKLRFQAEIQENPEESRLTKAEKTIEALQFCTPDEKQIIQIRSTGFSFNRLVPYTSLDDYLPDIQQAWSTYVQLAKPLSVKLVKMRYLNRISIPAAPEGIKIEEFFTIAPRDIPDCNLVMHQMLSRRTATDPETNSIVNLTIASEPFNPSITDVYPFILDIEVMKPEVCSADDWSGILDKIQVLRGLKNKIFDNILTEKCKTHLSTH